MSKRTLPALLALLWLLEAARALAQPTDAFELKWSAPPGCPDGDAVRARVRALAGPAQSAGSPLQVEGTVVRKHGGGFHLRLSVHVDNLVGERDLDGTACGDLAGAAAVALALLLRSSEPLTEDDLAGSAAGHNAPASAGHSSDAAEHSSGDEREATRPPPAAVSAPSTTARVDGAQASATRSWRGLLQVPLITIGFGVFRQPSFGLALAAGVAVGRWSLLADGDAWLPQDATVVRQADRYGARIQRFSAGLRACRAFLGPRVQIAPCVSISAQHVSARGMGPNIAASEAKATWAALGIGAQTTFNVTRWLELLAGADAQFQTALPTIAIEGVGTVEKLPPVALTIRLGAEWIL